MTIYAINGSPRKNHNTAALLRYALDGASSGNVGKSFDTELIHLYDLNYQSCVSCFQCKLLGGPSYGKCGLRDDLAPLLEALGQADGIIFGSPIYLENITGKIRSFLERLLFPYLVYDVTNQGSIAPKRMPTAFIYSMGAPEAYMKMRGYPEALHSMEEHIGRIFSKPHLMYSCDTYQFDDYSKYKADFFSEPAKAAHRTEQFPLDKSRAFEIGKALVDGK